MIPEQQNRNDARLDGNDAPDDEWDDWLQDWGYSVAAQHASTTTVVYHRGISQFRSHLAHAHPDVVGPEQVTRRHVESWLAELAASGRGPATRRVRLMTLKAFYRW